MTGGPLRNVFNSLGGDDTLYMGGSDDRACGQRKLTISTARPAPTRSSANSGTTSCRSRP